VERTQLIVIGSGAAGLVAALTAAPHAEVVLVTDRALGRSNTAMAQGGLQLPEPDAASREAFVADMLDSARVPVDEPRVQAFAGAVGAAIDELVEWGLELRRDADGRPIRRIAGGMGAPRVVDTTTLIGPALLRLLRRRLEQSSVTVLTDRPVQGIVPGHDRLVLKTASGPLAAETVVCCSGGISYREAGRRGHPTSNPRNDNHGLYDALVDLGLPRVEPDAFQYHPFGLVRSLKHGVGQCVPESISGFGVRLLDRHGRELAPAPSALRTAPDPGAPSPVGPGRPVHRDRYTLTRHMLAATEAGRAIEGPGGHRGFRLTLSDLSPETLEADFPRLARTLRGWGQLGDDVIVAPFLHYQLGGFAVGPDGATRVPGLYLAGEMVGGMHGLNRLMGNGLTDSLVHGRSTALAAVAAGRP